MRYQVKDRVVEMARRGVSARMIHLAVMRTTPATRLKLATVERIKDREAGNRRKRA